MGYGKVNYSQISDTLFVGTQPGPQDYSLLKQLGIHLVINMRIEKRPHPDPGEPHLPVLWLPCFDNPLLPIPVRFLLKGVTAALNTIEAGGKVYTHCAQGVHRGAAMGAAILIAQGHSPLEAMNLVKERRQVSNPHIWYIRRRIQRFADEWLLQNTSD